jgi:hypothetical protein
MARLPKTEHSFPDGYTYAHTISNITFHDRSDGADQRMQSPATALRTAAAGYTTAVTAAAATADGPSVRAGGVK